MTPAELKAKWIEALKSGRYPQGKTALHTQEGYCCLGVLCDIVDPTGWQDIWFNGGQKYRGCTLFPPAEVSEHLPGLHTSADLLGRLSNLNDQWGKSFAEIAQVIEEELQV